MLHWATTTLNMLTLNEIALQTYQFKQQLLQFTVRMDRINILAIYNEEITFLYNIFLSMLLSNDVATAKAAVRGRRAAVGQAAKGRRRGGQKRQRVGALKSERRHGGWTPEATGAAGCVPSGGVARTSKASGRAGREPGGACGGARAAGLESSGRGMRRGVWRGSCSRSGVEQAGRRLSRTRNTFRVAARVRFHS
jgi:hypothetical protein